MTLEDMVRAIVREELATAGVKGPLVAPVEAAKPKPRGRPPKVAEDAPAAPAPAPEAPDPFDAPAPAPASAPAPVTLDEVKKALTALREATSQERALEVLEAAGGKVPIVDTDPKKFPAILKATQAAIAVAPATPEEDPFEAAAPVAAVPEPTLEEVKAEVVAAQKRTGTDKVQKVVMDHGGTAPTSSGAPGPSLKALPVASYAKVIAAVKALPATK